jgi:hypothetical protein
MTYYYDTESTILCSYSLIRVLRGEATNTHFVVFGLTPPGLAPTIYHTRGEHANHYTIDAVRNENYLGKCSLLYNVLNFSYKIFKYFSFMLYRL